MTKNMYILIGPPGSGKTTWVEKEFQGECFVVSSDKIIEEIAAEKNQTYNEVFHYAKVAEAMMWQEFDKAIEIGHNPIVVDRTNMSVGARARFFNRLKQWHKGHQYAIHAVVFPKPEDAEHERRLNRPGKTIPPEVISRMLASFKLPTAGEGFASVTIIED